MRYLISAIFCALWVSVCSTSISQPLISSELTEEKITFDNSTGRWVTVKSSGPVDSSGHPKMACTKDRQNDFKHLVVITITRRDWISFSAQYPIVAAQLKALGLYREMDFTAEKVFTQKKTAAKRVSPQNKKKKSVEDRLRELENRVQDVEGETEDFIDDNED